MSHNIKDTMIMRYFNRLPHRDMYPPKKIPIALLRRIDGKIQQVPLIGYGGKPDPEDPKDPWIWVGGWVMMYLAWKCLCG